MLHVAQISFYTDPAGRDPEELLAAWPTLSDVAEAAADAGVRLSVIQASTHSCTIVRNGVRYSFLPFGCGAAVGTDDRAFAGVLRALEPQVLHVHGLGFAPDVARLSALMPTVPIVLQDHADRPPRPWRRAAARCGFEAASGLTFSALEQARPFAQAHLLRPDLPVYEVPESTSRFVPGDRAASRRAAGVHGDPLLLWVGHLNANKDPLTVLAGIGAAARALPGLQLWLCFGSGPLLPEVRRRIAADPTLSERVHLLGRVAHDRVEQLMRAADAFVLGSHHEGSGYALIEALACGLAPVVTDIPSFRALTGGGRVGALWPPGDAQQLCEALLSTIANPRREARTDVRAHFDAELSLQAVGRKLRLVYDDVLRRRRLADAADVGDGAGGAARSTRHAGVRRTGDVAAASAPSRPDGRPLVSIVLPTFNRLHYLRITVDSIIRQSLRDWELIIVDDGSAAQTRAYLQSLEDAPRTRVIWLPHTGNPAAARNAALQAASGEFIAFIDSDDVWLPEKLAVQVSALQSRTGCGWCYTGFALVDATGQPVTTGRALRCLPIEGWILEPLLDLRATVVMSSVLTRRALLEAAGGFDEALWVCEEFELWMRLAQRSEIAFIDAPLVQVRRHAEHYADDVTSCEDLVRMFEALRHTDIATQAASAFEKRRAIVSAVLARSYATSGRRGRALGKLVTSLHYSWRYAEWWRRSAVTAAAALAPAAVTRLLHKLRPAPLAAASPADP